MKKRLFLSLLAVLLMAAILILPILNSKYVDMLHRKPDEEVSKAPTAIIKPSQKPNSPQKETLPKSDEKMTFIVEVNGDSLLDTVLSSDGEYGNVPQLLLSGDGKAVCDTIRKNQAIVKASIQKLLPDSDFSNSFTYYAVVNGFSVQAPMSTQEKIRKINGVKNVYVSDTVLYAQSITDNIADTNTISQEQNSLLNTDTALDGQNTLLAVIDTEFDVSHEVFSSAPPAVKYDRQQAENIFRSVNFSIDNQYQFDNVYQSDKIIYAYDYVENDNDTYHANIPCHGTHTASLAAGNNGKDDETAFRGIACNAQLALMKVSSDGICAMSDTILAALDDCAKLGADIINIGFGSDKISDIFREPFEKLQTVGTAIICPCGNAGHGDTLTETDTYAIDYSTLNFISDYENVISVASSANPLTAVNYIEVGDSRFAYRDIHTGQEEEVLFHDLAEEYRQYIFLLPDENGEYDYSQAQGKIAVIETDMQNVTEQARQAFYAEASALAVIHSGSLGDNTYNNIIEHKYFPVAVVDDEYSGYFEDYPEGVVEIGENAVFADYPKGNAMSEYSSWGVTADLRLKPEITTVGENVYSANSDGRYSYISGTSVSSAVMAGAFANIRQYLLGYEWFSNLTPPEQVQTVTAVIMSNAEPVKQYSYEDDELLYISPRKQGAGRVDIESVMQSGAYLTMSSSIIPKADIGDSITGDYEFSFRIHNISAENQLFSLRYLIQTDKPEQSDNRIINTFEPYSLKENAVVQFVSNGEEVEEITVPSQDEVEVTVNIHLNDVKELAEDYFPNGFYTDGYIVAENEGGRTLNLPFMGFYGDWGKIDPFYGAENNDLVGIDYNAVSEYVDMDNADTIYLSKNTVGSYYDIAQLKNAYLLPNFRLLRDTFDFTVTVSDTSHIQLFSYRYGTVNAHDRLSYMQLLSDRGEMAEFFSNLPDGDYIYTVSARTMTSSGTLSDDTYSVSYPLCIDSQKPDTVSAQTYRQDNKTYLSLTAKDNRYLKGFELYTAAYNSKTRQYEYADKLHDLMANGFLSETACIQIDTIQNDDGTVSCIYDITSLYDELVKLQFLTRSDISPFSSLYIAYKAYDGAYNASAVKTADAVTYQTAVFQFTDQNHQPVQGVSVRFSDKTLVSDKNGKAVFEGLLPDIYFAEILSVPQDYTMDKASLLVVIQSDTPYIKEFTADFYGEYPEVSEESVVSVPEENTVSLSENIEDRDDNPVYAVIFVGILLLISSVALIVSRQRRK